MYNRYLIDNKTGLLLWKTSNLWKNSLRKILSNYSLTLNEFIILETLSFNSEKELIYKKSDSDNRIKIIELTQNAKSLIKTLLPSIYQIENDLFMKLGSEKDIFINSMKLILGKKIRIKAEKK